MLQERQVTLGMTDVLSIGCGITSVSILAAELLEISFDSMFFMFLLAILALAFSLFAERGPRRVGICCFSIVAVSMITSIIADPIRKRHSEQVGRRDLQQEMEQALHQALQETKQALERPHQQRIRSKTTGLKNDDCNPICAFVLAATASTFATEAGPKKMNGKLEIVEANPDDVFYTGKPYEEDLGLSRQRINQFFTAGRGMMGYDLTERHRSPPLIDWARATWAHSRDSPPRGA
jgi:apolipoprotein N-acyltransferase